LCYRQLGYNVIYHNEPRDGAWAWATRVTSIVLSLLLPQEILSCPRLAMHVLSK
jgi:hypothetical protein